MRKAEEGKEVVEAEARQLAEEREVGKKKVKEEAKWLRQELQELQARFSIQKEKLEVEYQKQMDDMFFYGYRCSMKKHGITQDTPRFPSNDEDETVGGPDRGGGDAARVGPSDG